MQCTVLSDDDRIDVLYGEATPAVEGRVRAHLEACAACREEMGDLQATRRSLAVWRTPRRPRGGSARRLAAFALPVAAALLVATAGALLYRGAEVRYEDGRFALRLGQHDAALRLALAEQEERHAREIAALRAALPVAAPAGSGLRLDDVRGLIRESEARQGELLRARLEDLRERSEAQRRIDLARVSAGLSYLDGRNGQQMARASELMNTMLRASYTR
jgi:hypothetical protein